MAPTMSRVQNKPHLSKNKSVKIYREKRKKQEELAKQRDDLKNRYEQIDTSKIETFQQFPLTFATQKGLRKCEYTTPTEIQLETIGLALKGKDVLGAAKTGSGKTLAFVIPILEKLFCEGWCKSDGLGALVIAPTRELAMQIFEVCRNVGAFHDFTMGLVIGGKDLKEERKILNLYNIVICTPGRLLQHLDQNPLFTSMNLQMLVLDEADRILDMGFQKEMNAILEHLPQERQTLLFSATQTRSVKDLARLSLKDPTYVSVHEHAKHATPQSLEQSFIVCELHRKMDFLWSFIKNHKRQKTLIFMASCKQVKYTFESFCRLKPGVSLMALYGGLHQLRRMERYKDFCKKNHVVMFATDLAARGLDFPNVNWVVQLDCPEDVNTYIHRAGRTARYEKGGKSLLVLLPSEKESMVEQLETRHIPINEIEVHYSKIMPVQNQLQLLCSRDSELRESAERGFKSYYKSIFLMKDKSIFNINEMNKDDVRGAYARSIGLKIVPRIRFIERRCKATVKKIEDSAKTSEIEDEKGAESDDQLALSSLDSALDDLITMQGTSQVHTCSDDEDEEKATSTLSLDLDKSEDNDRNLAKIADMFPSKTSTKVLTKAAVVKKALKHNLKPSIKILFDESGEAINIPGKLKSQVANKIAEEIVEEGYSIERAKMMMEAEDEIDKVLFKNRIKQRRIDQKKKLKEKQEEHTENATLGTENNEDAAVDDDGSSDEDQNTSNDSDGDSEEDDVPTKRRKVVIKSDSSSDVSETEGVDMDDDEMLAMHFLENS